jgi:hypothetical protein
MYMLLFYEKIKPKTEAKRFPLIHLPFAHRANGSLPVVCMLTKKKTEVICLQTN